LLGGAIFLTFLGEAQRLNQHFRMRKNIVVDGLLQCLVGDQRLAGVCRLRQRWDAAGECEGACNRESNKQSFNLHNSHASITPSGPACGTRETYFIVPKFGMIREIYFPVLTPSRAPCSSHQDIRHAGLAGTFSPIAGTLSGNRYIRSIAWNFTRNRTIDARGERFLN
jgi:hypothetical protein